MPDLQDGESTEMQGSAATPYILKNVGGVYSCTCPAWRNQSTGIEKRTCKHLRKLRGDAAEEARIGDALPGKPKVKEGESTEPPLLLAESWDCASDVTGWWMSEKLDGVRAYWNGKEFISRQGNLYHAPDWFVKGLPPEPLDGELWLARKAFQRTISIVRRQDKSNHWKDIRYLVFDAPGVDGEFERRLEFIDKLMKKQGPDYAGVHEHVTCKGIDHLRTTLTGIEEQGGEGLMLRKPGSRYVAGRSTTLLKVKTFHDAEARVIGHQAGAGRHKGRLGALQVQLADGTKFCVGTGFSDKEREDPPAIGSTINFRYQELSDGGVPRFPSYVGLRTDVKVALPAAAASPPPKKAEAAKPVAATAAPRPKKEAEPATQPRRRFEFSEGKSDKFWEIAVDGTEVTVRFGRKGSEGQTKTKSFPDEAAAARHAEKLIEEKTEKGYVEEESE